MRRLTPPARRLHCLAAVFAALIIGGCQSMGGMLRLYPDHGGQQSHRFSQAYIAEAANGDREIVLLDSAGWTASSKGKGRPLEPTELAPLRQMVHLRVFWRAIAGTTNNPAAANAAVEWHILGPEGSGRRIVYEGAAQVAIGNRVGHRLVTIRDGHLSPSGRHDEVQDPVGPARIVGAFRAVPNSGRVRDALAELDLAAQPVNSASGGHAP